MRFNLLRFIVNNSHSCISSRGFGAKLVRFNKTNEIPDTWKDELERSMCIFPDFISEKEEEILLKEIEPYMRRLRYEYAHWDNAIHGYRETEKRQWDSECTKILDRVREKAFSKNVRQLPSVHVLDLAEDGWIKPHVDSIKFCGDVIAGLSLLTSSIMRLTMVGYEKEISKDYLLPRRSLYIMSGVARHKFNHEILKNEESYFEGRHIPKTRRISVICRCEPVQTTKECTV